MAKIRRRVLRDWDDFKRTSFSLLYEGPFVEGRYLFRGMADASWRLVASFDRLAGSTPLSDRQSEGERLLALFAQECADNEVLGSCPEEPNDLLAVAQHFGLPTRGLDWTESPYIAAYFALAAPGGGSHAAIWALHREHPVWTGTMGATLLRPRRTDNERLLRQRGWLSQLRGPYDSLEAFVEACQEEGIALTAFHVPREAARTALADLSAMGITATQLFPDRSGAARAAVAKFHAG